jgi:hypothetical protein
VNSVSNNLNWQQSTSPSNSSSEKSAWILSGDRILLSTTPTEHPLLGLIEAIESEFPSQARKLLRHTVRTNYRLTFREYGALRIVGKRHEVEPHPPLDAQTLCATTVVRNDEFRSNPRQVIASLWSRTQEEWTLVGLTKNDPSRFLEHAEARLLSHYWKKTPRGVIEPLALLSSLKPCLYCQGWWQDLKLHRLGLPYFHSPRELLMRAPQALRDWEPLRTHPALSRDLMLWDTPDFGRNSRVSYP